MELFIGWVVLSVFIGVAASARGRGSITWFLLACVLSPLLAGLLLLLFPSRQGERVTRNTHVRCPDCQELVRREARKCRHCGCPLIPQ